MAERENSLENKIVRLEERQRQIRDDLSEQKDHRERIDKQIAEMALKIQKLEWEAKRDQAVLPPGQQIPVDPALIRIAIVAVLTAVAAMATGNIAFFGD